MFAIKNEKTGMYAKHTGETNSDGCYVEYPWKMVGSINEAQQYTTQAHANEVAFWHLDNMEKWLVVNANTNSESEITSPKYFP